MLALYVCSPSTGAGKTALCVGLARRLAADGLAVAYLKPVGSSACDGSQPAVDPDVAFARQALRLRLPPEILTPVDLARPPQDGVEAARRLHAAFEAAAQGRDAVLLEGAPNLRVGGEIGLSAPEVLALLDARALVVAPYAPEGLAESILDAHRALGGRAVGVVINLVPELGRRHVEQVVRPALAAAGVELLGVLPLSHELLGVTVGELVEALQGRLLCAEDQADLPVEAYMISAMSDLGADDYFRRRARKAVIASGDRPDTHLPALQTDTSCIVLTNGLDPDPTVLALARDQGVPLIKVPMDTFATLEVVADLLPTVRFRQPFKVPAVARLFDEHFDYAALRRALSQEAAT